MTPSLRVSQQRHIRWRGTGQDETAARSYITLQATLYSFVLRGVIVQILFDKVYSLQKLCNIHQVLQ